MKIYETSVRKPISTILIYIGVVVLGLFSMRNLAVDMYPEMEIPAIMVITTYAGANAADIETNVTRPLEDNLNTVTNLKDITSRTSDNLSVITLEFEWGSNIDEASNDVRDILGRTQDLLPDEVNQPIIFKLTSTMMPVLVIAATADESYPALNKILDDKLVNPLNRVNGVGAISMMGQPVREVQVNVDPQKLEAYNLSVEQIGQIIAAENVNVPGGSLDLGRNTINIKADTEFSSSDDLKKITVARVNGREIMLTDVATIRDTLQKSSLDERINGKKGVRIIIQKQSGANTVDIAKTVMERLPELQKTLPRDVKIDVVMDGSESIVDSIDALTETVLLAFVFVIIVVLFFLGRWRATIIICLTIPISLVVSFIYLFMVGDTLNIISLSSLSIAIGMVVDDAIVVLENITKHIERGSSSKEAAIYGTNEVWLAVITTTLTVLAVFMPLTMITGMMGVMFKPLGWIVSLVITVSTIAAITMTPMLSAYMLKAQQAHTYKGLGVLFRPIDRFLDKLDNGYAKILTWAVRHRAGTFLAALGTFAASVLLLTRVPMEFFPVSDNAFISGTVELESGVGVQYTSVVAKRIDSVFKEHYPEISIIATSAGMSEESDAFRAMRDAGRNLINYMIKLPRASERKRDIFEIADSMRRDLAGFPEVKEFTITPGGDNGGSAGGGSEVAIKVFGYDLNVTNKVADDLRALMDTIPGTRDVQLSRKDMQPELNIVFDRDKLARYGLTSATAAAYVRNRINGLDASKYREDGDEYDIVVRYDEPFRESVEEVENILIYNNAGQGVRLSNVAEIEEVFAPPTIERENRQRIVTVKGTLAPGVALGTVLDELDVIMAEYDLPEGVILEKGGSYEEMAEAVLSLLTLAVLIIILVYIVMATQFESFLMPFINMFTLLFAFTGVFLALWITHTPLSVIAMIGAVMLIGIVVKNGIVMVDYINLLRERGSGVNQSVIAAGKSRLRPVLMTSLTTILGMLPLAIGMGEGSEIWQPMGIAVIGGLTFSTLLTLIEVPVIYSIFIAGSIKRQRSEHKRLAAQAAWNNEDPTVV